MRVLALFLLLALPVLAQAPPPPGAPPAGRAMPDVRGLSPVEARRTLEAAGIRAHDVVEVQVREGLGRVVRQKPLPGAAVGPQSARPVLSVGVAPVERPPASGRVEEGAPRKSGWGWWGWLLVVLGTGGMAWMAREVLGRWEPPSPPEPPSVQVTRVTAPPRRRR